MTGALHDDELPVDTGLVRALVDDQLPAYAPLPLHRLAATGSDNALFRLGDELLVRVPRRAFFDRFLRAHVVTRGEDGPGAAEDDDPNRVVGLCAAERVV